MKTVRILALPVVIAALVASAFSQPTYRAIDVKNGGKISGIVRLKGAAPMLPDFPVGKDNDWCGTRKKSPRLVLGKNNGVANAVISLEGITQGKKHATTGKFVLDQRKCEYMPHVLLLPMGASLEIVNSDAVLHNVHAYDGRRTVFNIAQPVKGFRFPVKPSRFETPGPYHATCDAGHPWMSAYVIVTEHPYYALADANGKFELSHVPPGTYKIKMWHEGVHVVQTEKDGGQTRAYQYESAYEEVKEVTVPANGNVTLDFSLELRSPSLVEK